MNTPSEKTQQQNSEDTLTRLKDSASRALPIAKDALSKLPKGESLIGSMKTGNGPSFPTEDYASLCLLSYERPNFLRDTLKSLSDRPGYNYQLIIHDDGSQNKSTISAVFHESATATVIMNPPGHNQGQGVALNRMFNISRGDPIIKLDADLHFYQGWLLEVVRLMRENPSIGLLGLLHYYHEPVDSRKTVIERHDEWSSHTHILGSAFAVRRQCWEELGPFSEGSEAFAEDWEFQQKVTASDKWVCALPKESLCKNNGMGIGKSTIVLEGNIVKEIHKRPAILSG